MQAVADQAAAARSSLDALTSQRAEEGRTLAANIETLKTTTAAMTERLSAIEAWMKEAQPARVAEQLVGLAELRRLVDAGAPFAAPLARVQQSLPAAAPSQSDAQWTDYADTGIPTIAELGQRLQRIAATRPNASPVESGSEWVDSAVGSLLRGVRVGDGPPLGADPVATALYQAQQALAKGDLDAADAAVAAIAEQVPAIVEWRKALTARRNAAAAIAAWDKSVLAAISEAPQ